jgi:hypothetical protein
MQKNMQTFSKVGEYKKGPRKMSKTGLEIPYTKGEGLV